LRPIALQIIKLAHDPIAKPLTLWRIMRGNHSAVAAVDTGEQDRGSSAMSSNAKSPDDSKRVYRRDLLLASLLVTTGLVMSGLSLTVLMARDPQQTAQATQPLQSSPPEVQDNKPAEAKPGGDRPTTPAPEPARPDAQAQKAGTQPVLPPAPAEKIAPPIKDH
jgi:hypothetical protein